MFTNSLYFPLSAVNLPSIAASPIKTPTGFNFTCGEIRETSPSSPLQAPFGSLARRTQTCPINIDATEGIHDALSSILYSALILFTGLSGWPSC